MEMKFSLRYIGLIVGAFLVIPCILATGFVYVHAKSPETLGFSTRDWPTFWVTIWATVIAATIPTIITAAVLAFAAGLYLSDRGRNLDQRESKEALVRHCEEQMATFASSLIGVVAIQRYPNVDNLVRLRGFALRQAEPIWVALNGHPLPLWRRTVRGYDFFFDAVDQFKDNYIKHEQIGGAIDFKVYVVVQAIYRAKAAQLGQQGQSYNASEEESFRLYALVRIAGVNADEAANARNLDQQTAAEFERQWTVIDNMSDIGTQGSQYRKVREQLVASTKKMTTSCEQVLDRFLVK